MSPKLLLSLLPLLWLVACVPNADVKPEPTPAETAHASPDGTAPQAPNASIPAKPSAEPEVAPTTNPTPILRVKTGSEILNFQHTSQRFGLSADGTVVEFAFTAKSLKGNINHRLARFAMPEKTLSLDTQALPSLNRPRIQGESSRYWRNTPFPSIHKTHIRLKSHERSWSLALAAQSEGFLLGTNSWLRYYDSPKNSAGKSKFPAPLLR